MYSQAAEKEEIEKLQKESELPLEELLKALPKEVLEKPASIDGGSGSEGDDEADGDDKADSVTKVGAYIFHRKIKQSTSGKTKAEMEGMDFRR